MTFFPLFPHRTYPIFVSLFLQYYFKGDNYFEVDIDVGSSSVAKNVVGLAIGYSKAIVVDIGFCLQGNEEYELPEVLLGGCTCVNIDTTTAKKL